MRSILFCLLLLTGSVHADQADPARLTVARALVELLEVERTLDAIRTAILDGAAQMAGEDPPPEAKAILDRYTTQMFDEMVAALDPQETAARLYAEHFTAEELEQVLAFYRSPAGAKLLDQLPRLMEETAVISNHKFEAFQPRMQEISNAMAAELDELRDRAEPAQQPAQ